MPEALAREIDIFETQIELRKKGKIEEKLFAETRLRRGVYGQRYDNGQRHDGEQTQNLTLPLGRDHQGPQHAVGRPRHAADQDPHGPAHRRPARCAGRALPRSTRTASCTSPPARTSSSTSSTSRTRRTSCGGWRPWASPPARPAATPSATSPPARWPGVCRTESFDVTPYANAHHLLPAGPRRHAGLRAQVQGGLLRLPGRGLRPDQLPRRRLHRQDPGGRRAGQARLRATTSAAGWARCPYAAQLFDEFLPEEELLPMTQAIAPRVRAPGRKGEPRHGAPQVPGQEAGLRGVQAAGAGGAQAAAPRPALDRLPGRPARHRREAAAPGGQAAARAPPRRVRGLAGQQRAAPAPGRATRSPSSPCRWAT